MAVEHADVMNRCDAKAGRVGLSGLTAAERVVVLVSRANFEIELGGLDPFFYNSAGGEAVPTVDALDAVGATRAAAALRAANAPFPGGSLPRDREERFAGLEVVRGLPGHPLSALEREFGRDEPDVFSRVCSFIEARAAELRVQGWRPNQRAAADRGRPGSIGIKCRSVAPSAERVVRARDNRARGC
jgi:hypothetical protein